MPPLRVHTCVSGSHQPLVARHLRPTFDATSKGEASLIVHEAPQHCRSGRFREEGWTEITREKLLMARAAANGTADGEPFAVCDADVAFLGPWVEPTLTALNGNDMVAMDEPGFGPAFWIGRNGARLRGMLDDLLSRWGTWPGDGAALLEGIEIHHIELGLLDNRFANPGNIGHPLPLTFGSATFTPPPETLLFHANFCLLEDKDLLLAEVRRLAGGGYRAPNDELAAAGPEGLGFFPPRKPDRPFDRQSMLTRSKALDILTFTGDREVSLIVEIGSWLGGSTRWFLETFAGPRQEGLAHEQAEIICIDAWGSGTWQQSDLQARSPVAWEQFAANCWHLRGSITPIRLPSRDGLPAIISELAKQGRCPDLVYIDGDHSYAGCLADITTCAEAWPQALILGDDYDLEQLDERRTQPVADAVREAERLLDGSVRVGSSGTWVIER